MPAVSHNVHRISYAVEKFRYLTENTDRYRPALAIALLGPKGKASPIVTVEPLLPLGVVKKSVAIYSQATHALDTGDLFLPGHDGGHLIAASLGGSDAAYNRVPMALDQNRGGGWRQIEESARACRAGLYAVRCTYNNFIDPRIPTRVEARLLQLEREDFATFNETGTFARVAALGPTLMSMAKATYDNPCKFTVHNAVHHALDQDPFHIVPPTVKYHSSADQLRELYYEYPLPNDFAIEDQANFLLMPYNSTAPRSTDRHQWNLPPLNARPNAWLDYMAASGHLNDVMVERASGKQVKINLKALNTNYSSSSVPGPYRNLLMTWNQVFHSFVLMGQTIYQSEAKDDKSDLGNRFTQAPEIDHIIPASLKGPTLFSNLRLTSRSYNNARRNSVDPALLRNAVKVGTLNARVGPKRAATDDDTAPTDSKRRR